MNRMQMSIRMIIGLIILLLCNTVLNAQVKKHKRQKPSQNVQQQPAPKKKVGASNKQRPFKNVRSKKIAMEMACDTNAIVFLYNIMRKTNIVTSSNNKVRLVTTVYYQGESMLSDSQWFSKLELSLTGNKNAVEIRSGEFQKKLTGNGQGKLRSDTILNGIAVFDSLGNILGKQSSSNPNITLYVPAGVKLEIKSKYADVTFENNIGEVKAWFNNGELILLDAEQLILTSVYGTISAGKIRHAEVELTNGKLKAKKIDTLQVTSKNSSIALDKVDWMNIKDSKADQFDIKEVQTITGIKTYGHLLITNLTGAINIFGVNADTKIKSIQPSVKTIKIDTKYADLTLPVGNLKNYTITFEGTGAKVYTPFEKRNITDTSFNSKVGSGKSTSFILKCNNCTVDFK